MRKNDSQRPCLSEPDESRAEQKLYIYIFMNF